MTVSIPRIDISSLSLGTELGRGGQGTVTTVAGLQADGQPAVLKSYSPAAAATLDADALEAAIAFPRELSPDDSTWLRQKAAWPAVLVEDSGLACGFLMRAVPDSCYFGFQTQTRGSIRKLADLAFLLNPDAYLIRSGLQVTDRARIDLLASVATALARLHALNVIVGDLSPKNLLFGLAPSAACFFIDCDAMHVRGSSALPQIQTPDWEIPAGEAPATAAADAYKLGLLAVRLFARDQSSTDPAALAAISPQLGSLAEASLTSDPGTRPAAGDWLSPLRAARSMATATATRISIPIPDIHDPAAAAAAAPHSQPPARLPGRRRAGIWALAGLGAAVALIIAIAAHHGAAPAAPAPGPAAQGSAGVAGQQPASASASVPGTSPPASSPPASSTPASSTPAAGLVSTASSASAVTASAAIADMLTTYFSGINHHRYYEALSVFAPDTADQSSTFEQGFARGLATTTDSDIVLENLLPAGDPAPGQAEVTFRSHQDPGYGPADDRDATCTAWDITYQVHSSGGRYQIVRVVSAQDSPC